MSVAGTGKGIRHWFVIALALAAVLCTARLGWWQLDRAQQKQALQTAIADAQRQSPITAAQLLAAWQHEKGEEVLHRRVQLKGRWLPEHTVFLDNRQMQGQPGFFVLTPFQLASGDVVLVQRGWAPRNFLDRTQLPVVETPSASVDIEARVAAAPSQLYALGDAAPDPTQPRIRQNLDISGFAQETRLQLAPWLLWQVGEDSGGLLRQWPAPDTGVAKHHGYAFQWFALSGLLLCLLLWFQVWKPRQRRNSDAAHAT